MNKEKIKQTSLIVIAICLIGIGYLNYNLDLSEKDVEVMAKSTANDITLGDIELVSTNAIVENEKLTNETSVQNAVSSSIEYKEEIQDEYFQKTRIERDAMYSQMIETYQEMLNNKDVSEEQKGIAGQEITNITKIKNGIMIAENLIKNKGFEDVVILVNNNAASVVVKSKKMENEEIAKIQNIVSREIGIEASNINISNK